MKTMNYLQKKKPVVIPAIVIAFGAIALAGITHTGPKGLYAFIEAGGVAYFLLTFWPEIRTSPTVKGLKKRWATKRRA